MLKHLIPTLFLAATATVASAQGGAVDRNDAAGRGGPAVQVSEFGRYTLRANAVNSESLAPGTAENHGIERAADRAVLNLVVLERKDGRQMPVRAEVSATQRNLLGQTEAIEMREIEQNGRVSYLGTFGLAPLRNFSFTITARPVGGGEPMTIEFEDRLIARDR
ncbi:MAG: DUF4426 domain-containing protein [Methylibium sp.]|uniref:DUF4426 domain-containing protein n=1 Tax=Methylibium sp. TaxID=2067992 RepID=UPI0017B243BD|nr:DUF4426 domain-containing protein [Methylibium sp.]MBA3595892.1 DUF4426 domain-containing protein [Methylibium sp.]